MGRRPGQGRRRASPRRPGGERRVTLRHLLTHTSGIGGDFFLDTGRSDDCLERYVAACAELGQDLAMRVPQPG
jgi:CubicO group peptidase (beta-lactamase class C family)